jgi:large subunit ribosomal protein L29
VATKKFKELKGLTKDELATKARELEKQHFEEKMKSVAGTLSDTAVLWRVRKDIARIKTLQTQAEKAPAGER